MSVPKQAVIFCGGRGERLRPITDEIPKPMVPIHGRPFLEYLIEQLRGGGVETVLLLAGYRGEQILDHFRHAEGVYVTLQPEEWETGRRLKAASELLHPQFLLLYGDNFAPVSLPWLAGRHEYAKAALTATVCQKKDGGNVIMNKDGMIELYCPGIIGESHTEIGYMIVERDPALAMQFTLEEHNWGSGSFSMVISQLAIKGKVAAFDPGCPYWSISDPERLKLTAEMLRPKKVILLDRDGVLNEKAPKGEYVTRRQDFRWIKENVEALRELAKDDFAFIVLTNQASIGRGMACRADVDDMHLWMSEWLRQRAVNVKDVFVCPHHWDDNCRCRKPLPGMFFDAAKKHNIRLDRCIYVGDDERDQTAAIRAGCRFLFAEDGWQDAALDTFKGWGIG